MQKAISLILLIVLAIVILPTMDDVHAVSGLSVSDAMAYPLDQKLALSWKNPQASDISKIAVTYNGQDVSGGKVFKLGAGAINQLVITGLENNKSYTYSISVTSGVNNDSVLVAGTPTADVSKTEKTTGGYNVGGWYMQHSNNPTGVLPGQDGYANVSCTVDTEVKASGNSSLKMISNINGMQSNVYFSFWRAAAVTPSNTYRVRFKAKTQNAKNINLRIDPGWLLGASIASDQLTSYDWREYSYDFKALSSSIITLRFLSENAGEAFWLDDVNLHMLSGNTETGDNLITDGGFEFEKAVSTESYYPSNVLTYGGSGMIAISWRNPSLGTIKAISLYRVDSDGSQSLVSSNFNKDLKGLNETLITGLENYKRYYYRLVFEYSDAETTQYLFSGITEARSNARIKSWNTYDITGSNNEKKFCPTDVFIDKSEIHSGAASLKIVSNINGMQANVYTAINQTLPLQAGKSYSISFWCKANSASNIKLLYNWAGFDSGQNITLAGSNETYGWKRFNYTLTGNTNANGPLHIIAENSIEAFWIDDLEIYETSGGSRVGDNLAKNPGFEEGVSSATPADLQNVVAEGADRLASIKWEKPSDTNISKVNIYTQRGDRLELTAEIYPDRQSADFVELTNDVNYSFILKTVNAFGYESSGVGVEVMPIPPVFWVSETKVYKNTTEIISLEEGTVSVCANVKNNKGGNSFTAELVVVLYNDDTLAAIQSDRKTIAQTASNMLPQELKASIEIPKLNEGNYHLEIFIWDSLSGMEILEPSSNFN